MNRFASIRETNAQHAADTTPAPANALQVFASDAIAAEEWRMQHAGDKVAAAAMKSSHAARAAVAELIEKSSRLASVVTFRIDDDRAAMLDDLYAALARCGGAP